MLNCWAPSPEERPTFSALIEEVEYIITCLKGEHYVNLGATYINLDPNYPFPPSTNSDDELDSSSGLSEEEATSVH